MRNEQGGRFDRLFSEHLPGAVLAAIVVSLIVLMAFAAIAYDTLEAGSQVGVKFVLDVIGALVLVWAGCFGVAAAACGVACVYVRAAELRELTGTGFEMDFPGLLERLGRYYEYRRFREWWRG